MTKEQLTHANDLAQKMRASQHLITNNEIMSSNLNFLFHNDPDFKKDFMDIRDKYYTKYSELFRNL